MKTIYPDSASFLITEDCNLACKYCFENKGRNQTVMSKEVIHKGLEMLCEGAKKQGKETFHAMIFGGEPLLMPEIVEEIFRYGMELGGRSGLIFTTSLVTNATILTTDIKRILNTYKSKANLSVQLSVDGIKEVHDKYRITKDGKGSFGIIEQNIPEWKALFADNMDRLSVHGCCNSDTLPYLYENYIFFREQWDIPRIWFIPIHSEEWKEDDARIYEQQLSKIADYILEKSKESGNYREVVNYAPIDRCLNIDMFPYAPCGAGKNFITITVKGELFPCHQIYFNDPEKFTKIGDLNTGIDELKRKIFVEYDNKDLSCAKLDPDCDAYHCYRCIAENWENNGSILSVVDCGRFRCEMSKIERKVQLRVREELKDMGLLDGNMNNYEKGNNPNNPACLCDSRGGGMEISNNSACNCGNSDNEAIAMALKAIIDKLAALEKGQEYILTKLFK